MDESSVIDDEALLDSLSLDDFELLTENVQESLGKGSFGVVQKIQRRGTNQVYALKSMRKQEVIAGELVEQVELEIQVQRRLKHRNVLRLYRHFEDSETVYLLLEYCEKGELYKILRTQKHRRFPEPTACSFFAQVAEGLQYLHKNNIVHRDIKPENLLVTHEDVLKIADFGWCAESNDKRTTFCGTLDYLAPEMIQGQGHNHTLDVWSAGVLLYEMIVGRPPFQSTNHQQLIQKILRLELQYPQFVPPGVQELVSALLQRDPDRRMKLSEALRHPWVLKHLHPEAALPEDHHPPVTRVAEAVAPVHSGSAVAAPLTHASSLQPPPLQSGSAVAAPMQHAVSMQPPQQVVRPMQQAAAAADALLHQQQQQQQQQQAAHLQQQQQQQQHSAHCTPQHPQPHPSAGGPRSPRRTGAAAASPASAGAGAVERRPLTTTNAGAPGWAHAQAAGLEHQQQHVANSSAKQPMHQHPDGMLQRDRRHSAMSSGGVPSMDSMRPPRGSSASGSLAGDEPAQSPSRAVDTSGLLSMAAGADRRARSAARSLLPTTTPAGGSHAAKGGGTAPPTPQNIVYRPSPPAASRLGGVAGGQMPDAAIHMAMASSKAPTAWNQPRQPWQEMGAEAQRAARQQQQPSTSSPGAPSAQQRRIAGEQHAGVGEVSSIRPGLQQSPKSPLASKRDTSMQRQGRVPSRGALPTTQTHGQSVSAASTQGNVRVPASSPSNSKPRRYGVEAGSGNPVVNLSGGGTMPSGLSSWSPPAAASSVQQAQQQQAARVAAFPKAPGDKSSQQLGQEDRGSLHSATSNGAATSSHGRMPQQAPSSQQQAYQPAPRRPVHQPAGSPAGMQDRRLAHGEATFVNRPAPPSRQEDARLRRAPVQPAQHGMQQMSRGIHRPTGAAGLQSSPNGGLYQGYAGAGMSMTPAAPLSPGSLGSGR
eukprot:TRINITY_DN13215_c0_g1_i1.p1 TRINITY_DN13215_c0_g1~~TRINITY_DN13215_c0_g1_i1.p1  ORF type:complete len:929 (+),score=233.98 TRINITY_DN13215_c0_g1_i1:135-2921(+)